MTLNLRKVRLDQVHAGGSPVAELMAVLHILAAPDHHPEARAWKAPLVHELAPDLRAEMIALSPLWARLRCRLLLPLLPPLDQDVGTELARIAALPLEGFVELCATGVLGFPGEVPAARDLLDSAEAAEGFIAQCRHRSPRRGELAQALVRSPEELRERVLVFLERCCVDFFDDLWRGVRREIAATAARLRTELGHRPLAEVLAGLSEPSAVVSAQGTCVRYDKLLIGEVAVASSPLLLVPSGHGWPHFTVKDDTGHPVVLQFAIARHPVAEQISLRDLGERLLALSSPTRMDLCRHLLGELITTSELARRMGTAESQVSRSLRQLRDAGLVESVRRGRFVYHRLRTETLFRLGRDVVATIMR